MIIVTLIKLGEHDFGTGHLFFCYHQIMIAAQQSVSIKANSDTVASFEPLLRE
jgi:hypothetical protein